MDLDQFKSKFIEEAYSLIDQLEESLLTQEENLQNTDNAQQIFRVMHTLKGVSGMYGFDHIGYLTHDLETILDLIRENKRAFTTDVFEVTLKTVDHFRNLLKDEKLEDKANQETQHNLLEEIALLVGQDSTAPPKNAKQEEIKKEADARKQTFYIIFYPTQDLLFRGVNILGMFRELADLGEYKVINHSFKEHKPAYKNINAWGVYLVTDKGLDAVEDVFMFVMDDCRILKVSNNNLFNYKEFNEKIESLKTRSKSNAPQQKKVEKTIQSINKQATDQPVATTGLVAENNLNKTAANAEPVNTTDENNPSDSRYKDVGKQLTSQIKIDASKLDRLMYLVSELVTTKSELNLIVDNKDYTKLVALSEKIDNLSRNFRENALNIRLVPVAEMIIPFKRMIRDLSKDLGKEVKFITQGIDTELDKNVIDRLAEPIMHVLRNCVDHGIELPDVRKANNKEPQGSIKFTSYYSGANVYIQIQDDGAGIDTQKVRQKAIDKGLITEADQLKEKDIYELLFRPGFSTAQQVTDVSGRGVGMEIVRKKINEVRGEVEINSELGLGTFITIKLHQTLSIIDTLLLEVDKSHYLVPISDIEFCEQEQHEVLYKNRNRQVKIDNELIPFVSLRDLFKHETAYPTKEKLIIINKNDKRIAIVADKIVGEHQAVLKPLGEIFQSQEYLSGASLLGDGTLSLMIDTSKIMNGIINESVVMN